MDELDFVWHLLIHYFLGHSSLDWGFVYRFQGGCPEVEKYCC